MQSLQTNQMNPMAGNKKDGFQETFSILKEIKKTKCGDTHGQKIPHVRK